MSAAIRRACTLALAGACSTEPAAPLALAPLVRDAAAPAPPDAPILLPDAGAPATLLSERSERSLYRRAFREPLNRVSLITMRLDDVLAALRTRDFAEAADVIARRIAQRAPKMRLERAVGERAARAVLAVSERDAFVALHRVMPRSTVELARAIDERGVTLAEADAIARYLVRIIETLDFERLATFDENHSHVTGREWSEIDYTGEGMTWQRQRSEWVPRGVASFKRASDIHAYFTGAERLPHWHRVYRPRGKMSAVAAP